MRMEENLCPRCGWPVAELPRSADSVQLMSRGRLDYVRCVCGNWLARINGIVVGATRNTGGPHGT
jgi:hypothetical protein